MAVARTFEDMLRKGMRAAGFVDPHTATARQWFRKAVMENIGAFGPSQAEKDPGTAPVKKLGTELIGSMLMYHYDPKLKDTLPYYDRFPLIFMVSFKGDRFDGINLHYLPPMARARLMDELYQIRTDEHYDYKTKLNLSYALLKHTQRFAAFKPCYKQYLLGHLRSVPRIVDSKYWDLCMILPMARFSKAPQEQVWQESMDSLDGKKGPRARSSSTSHPQSPIAGYKR